MSEYIPLEDCQHGYVYKINSRNLEFAVFDAPCDGFIGIRYKLGSRFLFTEYHHDTGPPHGTATPLKEICRVPDDVEISTRAEDKKTGCHVFAKLFDIEYPVVKKKLDNSDPDYPRIHYKYFWASSGEEVERGTMVYTKENKKLFDFLEKVEEANQ